MHFTETKRNIVVLMATHETPTTSTLYFVRGRISLADLPERGYHLPRFIINARVQQQQQHRHHSTGRNAHVLQPITSWTTLWILNADKWHNNIWVCLFDSRGPFYTLYIVAGHHHQPKSRSGNSRCPSRNELMCMEITKKGGKMTTNTKWHVKRTKKLDAMQNWTARNGNWQPARTQWRQ